MYEQYLESATEKKKRMKSGRTQPPISSSHGRKIDEENERRRESGKLVAHFGKSYLPVLFGASLTCGVIIGMDRIYSYESLVDMAGFMEFVFSLMFEDDCGLPDVGFYDLACGLLDVIRSKQIVHNHIIITLY